MKAPDYFMVFDVESVGLHGEGFSVGFVVLDANTGEEVAAAGWECLPMYADGTQEDRGWVANNVPLGIPGMRPCQTTRDVREHFWGAWTEWKAKDAVLAADVPWPVEARFLAACVDQGQTARRNPRAWDGPYPLLDIASIRYAVGLDPLGTEERTMAEKPAHNPICDARQSARLLWEALMRAPEYDDSAQHLPGAV